MKSKTISNDLSDEESDTSSVFNQVSDGFEYICVIEDCEDPGLFRIATTQVSEELFTLWDKYKNVSYILSSNDSTNIIKHVRSLLETRVFHIRRKYNGYMYYDCDISLIERLLRKHITD